VHQIAAARASTCLSVQFAQSNRAIQQRLKWTDVVWGFRISAAPKVQLCIEGHVAAGNVHSRYSNVCR
jgi:hypothetical protein